MLDGNGLYTRRSSYASEDLPTMYTRIVTDPKPHPLFYNIEFGESFDDDDFFDKFGIDLPKPDIIVIERQLKALREDEYLEITVRGL